MPTDAAHPALDPALVASSRLDEGRIDDAVEHMRDCATRLGEPRRRAENVGEERQQADRATAGCVSSSTAAGMRTKAWSRCGERAVGIGGAAERGEQGRGQLGQHLAGARAGHRGAAAEMPAAHRLGRALRIAEAEALQRLQRIGIVGRAGEDEAAGLAGELRPLLEQQRIMRLHELRMGGQRVCEGASSVE